MLFNSATFVAFFAVVYAAYLLTQRHLQLQNRLLLVASYIFYGSWDWRFLGLILLSTGIDFVVGQRIFTAKNLKTRRFYLTISVASNLSILGFFKYFNFFADSLIALLSTLGMDADAPTLNIILPVGISFYTFQTMSYTIDIYRRQLTPTNDFLNFALFVAFFPQLVAGPIERARHLLPQIAKRRQITGSMIDTGIFLVLWGYFKKVVIADNVGMTADLVFGAHAQFQGLDILIGVIAFAVQIYCDFSGYSDIARGICRLMGFDLMVNFRLPYFAVSPSDFWTRWHISLSSWLRDYLYISLGGNRRGGAQTLRNLSLTMLLGGLWHGAAWNFVIWGAYHGLLLVIFRLIDDARAPNSNQLERRSGQALAPRVLLMFVLTLVGWLIFRAETPTQIWEMLRSLGHIQAEFSLANTYNVLFFSAPLVAMQLWQHKAGDLLVLTKQSVVLRSLAYALMLFGIVAFGVRDSLEFIYFQF